MLLDAGAETDKEDADHDTPLHFAAKEQNFAICEMLRAKGAKTNIPNSSTVWVMATSIGPESNVTITSMAVDTPLHRAVEQCNIDICKTLLDAGAEKNIGNSAGDTPLHCASKQHIFPIYEMLLAAGAENDSKNLAGDTPLH
eukprot:scpid92259/ scgid15371/ Ankyrin repeat domain-containing protein 2; Skeletal muscle ankyrin repeat protein